MWTQIIKTRVRPGKESEIAGLLDQLKAIEQPGSGLIRSTAAVDTKDPTLMYMMVTFESEEQARARESDPRRQEGLGSIRAAMGEIFDGPPEFIELNVIAGD